MKPSDAHTCVEIVETRLKGPRCGQEKTMTDAQVQAKLDQLVKLSNELVKEARRRYGPQGQLLYEADGGFHFMKHDESDSGISNRQTGVVMSSRGHSLMDCGAW